VAQRCLFDRKFTCEARKIRSETRNTHIIPQDEGIWLGFRMYQQNRNEGYPSNHVTLRLKADILHMVAKTEYFI
jgi:hypothetical protein